MLVIPYIMHISEKKFVISSPTAKLSEKKPQLCGSIVVAYMNGNRNSQPRTYSFVVFAVCPWISNMFKYTKTSTNLIVFEKTTSIHCLATYRLLSLFVCP